MVGFLVLGGMMAPPPYSVVVAVQDIPAYSTLDPTALGVDAERINSQAVELGIERPKLRNGFAIANLNTLVYVLINLRALQRIRQHPVINAG